MCGGAIIYDFIRAAESSRRVREDDVGTAPENGGGRKKMRVRLQRATVETQEFNHEVEETAENDVEGGGRKKKRSVRHQRAEETHEFNHEAEEIGENDVESVTKVPMIGGGDAVVSDFIPADGLWPGRRKSGGGRKENKSGRHQRMEMQDYFHAESQRFFKDDAEEEEFEASFQQFNVEAGKDECESDDEEEDDFEAQFRQLNEEAEDDDECESDEEGEDDFEAQFRQFNEEAEDDDKEEEDFEAQFRKFNDEEEKVMVAFGSKGPFSPECSSADFKGTNAKLGERKRAETREDAERAYK